MYKVATLNKISPVGLAELGEEYEISESLERAEAIIVRSFKMNDMEFEDELLAIGRAGSGTNNIPVDRCAEEGIVVFNAPGANANSVAELVIGAMFEAARNIPEGTAWANTLDSDVAKAVEKGKSQFAGHEISGKKMGVIGLGHVGLLVANKAAALGMDVTAYVRTPREVPGLSPDVTMVYDMDKVLAESDYLSIHIPGGGDNKGLIGAEKIAKMKDGVVFLNFARADIVDDEAMLMAVEDRKVARYITDFPNDKLVGRYHVVVIPHLGASTEESEERCAAMAASEVREYLEKGNIANSVNFPAVSLGDIPAGMARLCLLGQAGAPLKEQAHEAAAAAGVTIAEETEAEGKGKAVYLADISKPVDEQALLEALPDGMILARVL